MSLRGVILYIIFGTRPCTDMDKSLRVQSTSLVEPSCSIAFYINTSLA